MRPGAAPTNPDSRHLARLHHAGVYIAFSSHCTPPKPPCVAPAARAIAAATPMPEQGHNAQSRTGAAGTLLALSPATSGSEYVLQSLSRDSDTPTSPAPQDRSSRRAASSGHLACCHETEGATSPAPPPPLPHLRPPSVPLVASLASRAGRCIMRIVPRRVLGSRGRAGANAVPLHVGH